MRPVRPFPRPLLAALLIAAAAGGLATWTQKAPTSPAVVADSVGPTPASDAGSPLTDACSRRVGCLLR